MDHLNLLANSSTVVQCVVRHLTGLSPQMVAEGDGYSTARLLNYKCLLTTPFGYWIKGSNIKKKNEENIAEAQQLKQ